MAETVPLTPVTAAYRMACALALGAALGLLYDFLRPLRPRHTVLADLLIRLGVDEKTAVEDACRMEHVISDRSFQAIRQHVEK